MVVVVVVVVVIIIVVVIEMWYTGQIVGLGIWITEGPLYFLSLCGRYFIMNCLFLVVVQVGDLTFWMLGTWELWEWVFSIIWSTCLRSIRTHWKIKKNTVNILYLSLIINPTGYTNFSDLFLEWNSTCFGQFLCPSSGVFHCTHCSGICHTGLLCVQWKIRDDGQWNCLKHVEFHSKNKFEKLVHLVGFIIRNLTQCTVTWMSNSSLAAHLGPS
jgi:hypothetical protein